MKLQKKTFIHIDNLVGIANKDGKHKLTPELLKKEKEAWAEAVVDKHGRKHKKLNRLIKTINKQEIIK